MRVGVVVMVLGLVACTKPNPNRCCTDQADCDAHDIPMGTSCGSGLVCRGNQCIAEVCSSASDCDLSSPFCVDSSCTSMCTADDQCPGNGGDPANTHCEAGACVACRMGGSDCPTTAPVCDMGVCRVCQADSECSSAVCDRDSSACIDQNLIAYASPAGSTTSTCTMSDPCTLDRAVAVADASRPNVKLLPGTYSTGVGAPGTFTLSVYGPATIERGAGISGTPGGLRLRDLTFTNSGDNGMIVCERQSTAIAPPSLDVEDVSITSDNAGFATLEAADCVVRLERVKVTLISTIDGVPAIQFLGTAGSGGSMVSMDSVSVTRGSPGISLGDAATVEITNGVFENQGPRGSIQIANTGTGVTGTVSFSTFHNTLLACPTAGVAVRFSNNIFLNESTGAPTNTVTGSECSHAYDLIKPQATSVGATNLLNMDPRFVNAAGSDFHLMMGSPAIDAADPAATVNIDYDGTTRPQGAGRDLGAFEYKP